MTTRTPTVTSAAWWKAALFRALRTAIVIAVPYLGGASLVHLPWLAAGSAVLLGAIASLATSLAGLPELDGGSPIGLALLERVAKTAGQSLAAGVGTHLLFTTVNWPVVLQTAAIASLGSLFIGVLGYLPESTLPTPNALVNIAPAASAADVAKVIAASIPAANTAATPADPKQPAAGTPPSA